jgi:hypothetical protein
VIVVFLGEVNNSRLTRAEALQQAMAASMDVGIQERAVTRDMPNGYPSGQSVLERDGSSAQPS